jgi:aspartate kinase
MDALTKITLNEDVALVTLRNSPSDMKFFSRVFGEIARKGINVDMISQTAPLGGLTSLSFTVPDESLGDILEIFARFRAEYPGIKSDISGGNCKISFFGEQMRYMPGVAANVFEAIAGMKVDIIIITTSEIDISVLIPKSDYESFSNVFESLFGVKISRESV